jgi:non-haem Fe2+, alpha-ketoglutarate-dependent halogenase
MPKLLTEQAVRHYREQGYFAPVPILSADEAQAFRVKLEAYEAKSGEPLKAEMKHKPHLLFRWAAELVRHPRLLDAIEDVIGPDILCWSSTFFAKEARDPGFVSWHQDLTYWGLDPADVVTAWIALSPSTGESGAMRVAPGTHTMDVVEHRDTFDPDNMLTRGQEAAVEVEESRAVTLELMPGEVSLHHVKLVHGSQPNRSDDRRIGFAVRYIPTAVRQVVGTADSASLVRGTDRFHNFEPEPEPQADLEPDLVALHAEIVSRQMQVLYRGTDNPAVR